MAANNIFFSEEDQQKIVAAIGRAEKETSGEIRVHVESRCGGDALKRAVQVFKSLKMHKTELQNGTLIYLAMKDRKFAILGDRGINEKVPDDFWDDVKERMSVHFKKNDFAAGITTAVEMIGEKLKAFFPYRADDINELSDDISFGE